MSVKSFHYTICPVGNASYIAANREEFFQQGFAKLGVTPTILQSLPREQWHVHFDHQDPYLFREGGNIPPIWAKSNGTDVVLIGLSFLPQKGYVLVRADSQIDHVEQLRGRKLALPVREYSHIDFYKATIERGFETALAARGVAPDEVQYVPIPLAPSRSDVHVKAEDFDYKITPEDALTNGSVDALYTRGTRAQRLLATGAYKAIFEVTGNAKQLYPVENIYPNVLTVSRQLAEEAPEIVVEYLKQTLLAAQWAKGHLNEVLDLFAQQFSATRGEVTLSHAANFNHALALGLPREGLQALETQKRFLFDHGYIQQDFDVEAWADDRFLKAAIAQLQQEGVQG